MSGCANRWPTLAIVCCLALCACAGGDTVESPDPAVLARADIIIVGEVHDNPAHHQRQAELIEAVAPSAVAFEMLTPQQAAIVNQTSARGASLAEALEWQTSGWPDWSVYEPVFAALGRTPAYGMALPRQAVNRAVTEGAAPVFGIEAAQFGLTSPLPAAQQAEREAHQQVVHCGMLPESLLPGMVEAQRFRDAAFARTALQALRETGGPVIVITGTGHARTDWGMPVALSHAAPGLQVVSVGQLEEKPAISPPFDYWLVAEPAPRDDPCEGLSFESPG